MARSNQTTKYFFTKRKFLSFSTKWQHKQCAKILKLLYESHDKPLFEHYNEIQLWINGLALSNLDREEISNRYHEHVKLAGQFVPEHSLLPRVRKSDKENPSRSPLPITVYLENIRSSHNVGSILRTVEAFALGEVHFSPDTPFIDNLRVKKTSMGTYLHLKCCIANSLHSLPKPLIALETCKNAISLRNFRFPERFTLAIGNEEYGCSQKLLIEADYILEIPLQGRKNSLNVANAFAIAAAEIASQKDQQTKEHHGVS